MILQGPEETMERGVIIKSIYDFDDTITHYIRLVLYHDIKKFDEKISKEKIINILQKEFSDVLNYALESSDRVDRYLMPRRLKVPSIQTKNKIKKELILLRDSPLQILEN